MLLLMTRSIRQLLISLFVLTGAVVTPQTRISTRPEPKPEQTIHVTTTQELTITLNGVGDTSNAVSGQLRTQALLVYTQVNGRFDEQGRMTSQITIDRVDVKQSLSGTAKPQPNLQQFQGTSLSAMFDRTGKLVDVKVPKELQSISSILKQMVAGAYGALTFLPATTMAVGETTTAPSTIPMRLPGGGSPTSPYQTRTVTTLRAVETKGNDRIARFEQRIETDGKTQLDVTGSGTIDVNLDRGFVSASTTEWNFVGEGSAAAASAKTPPGPFRGTIKVSLAAHE